MLFSFLGFLSTLSSFFVISAKNPIHSVLHLIIVFICSSLILFSLGIEFISLTLILVYVGAIAVLFLFVVMMLNIKGSDNKNQSFFKEESPSVDFYTLVIFVIVVSSLPFWGGEEVVKTDFISWILYVDTLPDIEVLGGLLYTYHFTYFLFAGIILLVAMVGAIVLTLKRKKIDVKQQIVNKQVLRKKENALYLLS